MELLAWLARVIAELVIEGLLPLIGCFTLRVLTGGRYPRGSVLKRHEGRITLLGLAVVAALVTPLILWFR